MDAAFGALFGALFGFISGPQKSMMEQVKSSAGAKRLAKGITYGYAIGRTAYRELKDIGNAFVEEVLSTFVSWFSSESIKKLLGV